MKKLIALLVLVGAIGFGGYAVAEDKPAAPAAASAPAVAAPAAAAPATAAATAPAAAPTPVPNKGDVAWMLVCTAMVLLMSVPALALFYGGMVRSKNILSVLM